MHDLIMRGVCVVGRRLCIRRWTDVNAVHVLHVYVCRKYVCTYLVDARKAVASTNTHRDHDRRRIHVMYVSTQRLSTPPNVYLHAHPTSISTPTRNTYVCMYPEHIHTYIHPIELPAQCAHTPQLVPGALRSSHPCPTYRWHAPRSSIAMRD
jgi:hypothetical protein